MANIKRDELKAFKKLAKEMLALSDRQIESLKKARVLTEVTCHG
ncbi:MAG TPA: type II toxin-antitoxin system RelE/ParE family toxin [Stellaceae bacterium]|nr:type II toxin-antitoxin system RelE/ParE family toxin [Stellaceae bacterium]